MQKKTLIRLLESLDKKESKEFSKFLRSPFFNQRQDVIQLFDYYLEARPFLYPQIDKAQLFENIYPDESFDDAKIRHLLSYLTALIKKFYTYSTLKSDDRRAQLLLTEKLKQKGLDKDFEKEWIKTNQLHQQSPYRNAHYHYQQYLLQFQKSEFLDQQKRKGDINMQRSINELHTFYLASVLKQSCSILTHQKMSPQNYDFAILDEVLKTVEISKLNNTPAIAIYYYSLLTLKEPQIEAHYIQLKKLIQLFPNAFPLSEMRDIYLIAINYGIEKLNSGHQSYIREAFELYRSGLAKRVLLKNGMLSLFTYKNILNLGLGLKEFDWVENYLTEYQAFLNPEDRENHYTYCQAVFYFNKPDYNRVLSLIQRVNFKNKLHQLDARRMLLRIYYEQNEISPLESLLDSFQVYIRRQKDIGYHKEHYLNLIRFVRKFLKQNLENRSIRQKLRQELSNTEALAERRWLMSLLE